MVQCIFNFFLLLLVALATNSWHGLTSYSANRVSCPAPPLRGAEILRRLHETQTRPENDLCQPPPLALKKLELVGETWIYR